MNAPLQWTKQVASHWGGTRNGTIVHWPKGIAARGEMRHSPAHIIDIVPTLLAAARSKPPEQWAGQPVPPAPGKSLLPLLAKDGVVLHDSLWWQHEDNRALRVRDWKIVAAGKDAEWELYDMSADRSEDRNQAQDHPEKVKELAALWTQQHDAYAALARKDMTPGQSVQ